MEGTLQEAVALGIVGVLRSQRDVWADGVNAVAEELSSRGLPGESFRRLALERLHASGERALVTRTLSALEIRLPAVETRRLVRVARQALPSRTISRPQRAALARLASRHRLAFLDAGPPEEMERLLRRLGVADLGVRRLWTGSLGGQASPPSPLAFRWLAQRLDCRPAECVYGAGGEALAEGARRAGWQVLGLHETPPRGAEGLDPEFLADLAEVTASAVSSQAGVQDPAGD